MKLTFIIDETDLRTFLMYNSSKSSMQQKKRNISRWLVPAVYALLAILLLSSGLYIPALVIVLIAIGYFFYHPTLMKKRYGKHYEKHIEEKLSDLVNNNIDLEITPEYLVARDDNSETKTKTASLLDLVEVKDHFYLRLNEAAAHIIPKRCIADVDAFRTHVQSLGIPFKEDLDWEWQN